MLRLQTSNPASRALALPVAGLAAAKVKAPNGQFSGATAQKQKLALSASGGRIDIVGFKFTCTGSVTGSTSLQDIVKLKKTGRGYIASREVVRHRQLQRRRDRRKRLDLDRRQVLDHSQEREGPCA